MPKLGFDKETGHLTLDGEPLDRNKPGHWGEAGYLNRSEFDTQSPENPNEKYYDLQQSFIPESGETTYRWVLKPEVQERLGDRVQLMQSGVGGWSEVKDPEKVEWDPEFGPVTTPDNMNEDDPAGARRARIFRNVMLVVAAAGMAGYIPGIEGIGASTAAEAGAIPGVVGDAEAILASQTAAGGGVTGAGATTAGLTGTAATTAIPEIATAPGLVEAPITAANALAPAVSVTAPVSGNMLTQGWQWWQGLSPAARQLLGGALSTGVSAGLATSRQNDMIDARNQERDTARADTIRRGSVPLQTTTYTQRPLPGGLVASTMGQGGKT